jgi:hypothetical protein
LASRCRIATRAAPRCFVGQDDTDWHQPGAAGNLSSSRNRHEIGSGIRRRCVSAKRCRRVESADGADPGPVSAGCDARIRGTVFFLALSSHTAERVPLLAGSVHRWHLLVAALMMRHQQGVATASVGGWTSIGSRVRGAPRSGAAQRRLIPRSHLLMSEFIQRVRLNWDGRADRDANTSN